MAVHISSNKQNTHQAFLYTEKKKKRKNGASEAPVWWHSGPGAAAPPAGQGSAESCRGSKCDGGCCRYSGRTQRVAPAAQDGLHHGLKTDLKISAASSRVCAPLPSGLAAATSTGTTGSPLPRPEGLPGAAVAECEGQARK